MNYSELVTAIQDETADNDDPTFVANIPIFIQNAEKRIYQAVKIPAFRKSAISAIQNGSKYIALPSDYLAPWELAIINDSGEYNYLLLKDVSFIREVFPNPTTSGTPRYYSQFDENTFLVAPVPAANSIIELHYYYYPESIVTATNTWIGDNFPNTLLYGALIEAATFMKSEEDIVKLYTQQYSVNLKLLSDYAATKMFSGDYR